MNNEEKRMRRSSRSMALGCAFLLVSYAGLVTLIMKSIDGKNYRPTEVRYVDVNHNCYDQVGESGEQETLSNLNQIERAIGESTLEGLNGGGSQ